MKSPVSDLFHPFRRATIGLTLLLAASVPTAALDRASYSLEILVDGMPLQEYAARGRHYVEALEGREYAIRLTNRTSRRIAVALSVDGLNTIDAKSTRAGEAAKWIVEPHRSITLDGWQTGPSTARRFFFTTEEKSYGAWLGDTRNLGIVSAAVFRERERPAPIYREDSQQQRGRRRPAEEGRGGEAPRPSAPSTEQGPEGESEGARSKARDDAAIEPSDDYAATGIGRRIDHRVQRIRFDGEPSPAAVVELRYEYSDALARLGIHPFDNDPLSRRERSVGFEDFEFAPDPFAPPR